MSRLKSEIAQAVLSDVGSKIEDSMELAIADQHRAEGGTAALEKARQLIDGLLGHAQKDANADKLLAGEHGLVSAWLTRAIRSIEGQQQQALQQLHVARGRAEMAKSIVEALKRRLEMEQQRAAEEPAPTKSIKQQRLEEQGINLIEPAMEVRDATNS